LQDAWRICRGLDELRRTASLRAAAFEDRARRAVELLCPDFPGDARTGALADDGAALDAFFERHASFACPALDPRSGRCELYAHRPVACRTYGPPLRYAGAPAEPCRLCFQGAPREVVERCRWEPDGEGREEAILARLGPGAPEWETIVAFALAGGSPCALHRNET
jgi:Fe-S-cluster containining protein